MQRVRTVALAALLAGCAAGPPEPPPPLDQPVTRICVPRSYLASVEVLDDAHLAFRPPGGEGWWISMLPERCPGLVQDRYREFRFSGAHLCAHDVMYYAHRVLPGLRPCAIGRFERVGEVHMLALRQALQGEDHVLVPAPRSRDPAR